MTILLFLIILGVLVISHELGHFLLAKANGITVKEFWVGMGPTIFSFQKGETLYSLKLLPIGGACIFEGDNRIIDEKNADEDTEIKELSPGAFNQAGVWARISTTFAGPFFNFLLAYILAVIVVSNTYSDKPVVQKVMDGYPVQEAGIRPGDLITSMDGEKIHLAREIALNSAMSQGKAVTMTYVRDGVEKEVVIQPKWDEKSGKYLYGFQGYAEYFKPTPLQVIPYSFYEVRFSLKATIHGLKMLLTGKSGIQDLSGPVGVAQLVDDVTEQSKPYGLGAVALNLLNLAMLLSVNLGVMNLLPLPALDGGRLVFLFLEVLRGKPVPPEKEGLVHLAGVVMLGLLMLIVLYNDILRWIH